MRWHLVENKLTGGLGLRIKDCLNLLVQTPSESSRCFGSVSWNRKETWDTKAGSWREGESCDQGDVGVLERAGLRPCF